MANCKKTVLLAVALLLNHLLIAQNTADAASPGDNVEFMRSEGKIYVVMAVVITILVGLLIYMARLDKKISKLEKGGEL